jgi:hypothetical protein
MRGPGVGARGGGEEVREESGGARGFILGRNSEIKQPIKEAEDEGGKS